METLKKSEFILHLAHCPANATRNNADCICGSASTRTRVDVALGRLMAAIDDAISELDEAQSQGVSGFHKGCIGLDGMMAIKTAKESYDAARLAGKPSEPVGCCGTLTEEV